MINGFIEGWTNMFSDTTFWQTLGGLAAILTVVIGGLVVLVILTAIVLTIDDWLS